MPAYGREHYAEYVEKSLTERMIFLKAKFHKKEGLSSSAL
jgi:hypothetical protein